MENLLSQLRDIRGLDEISWWPLAPGWWMLLGFILFAGGILLRFLRKRRAYQKSWQAALQEELTRLRTEDDVGKDHIASLSEIVRRLAIGRFGRAQCAGYEGEAWLRWLAGHDPQGFRWDEDARVLTEAPYMPDALVKKPSNWSALIDAAENWVNVK